MTAKIVDQSRISETVSLDYPVEFDGVVWDKIVVRTPNVKILREFNRTIAAARENGEDLNDVRLPLYDAPDDILDALHPDDDDRLQEVGGRFLPRRFRADTSESASAPETSA